VAFPDTCVGTDSHTPHVDCLGVIAIGVGGLEAETVMLGRPTMMRLPEIIGVKLTGKRQPGITATDIVLALTEFLRNEKVVSAYLEFFGDGARSLTIGDRATISNMTPEFGASAGMFYIDEQTIAYLKLTGRDAEQVALVERYAKTTGLWADDLADAEYERVLEFDLSSVGRNMAGPSNPHRRLPTSALAERGIAGNLDAAKREEAEGKMPDGAVIIAAITSCTNTSNPRNVVAAGLLARKANALGLTRKPWVKSSFAPGSKVARLYLEEAGLLPELEAARLRHRRLRLHHLQRHERRPGPQDPAGDHRPRPLRHRGAVRQPQLRRPHPPLRQAGLPGLAAAGGGLRHRRHHALRHRTGRARHRRRRQADPAEGHLALGRGDRRHRRGQRQAGAVPAGLRRPCSTWVRGRRPRARSTTGARRAPTSAARPTGRAPWPASAALKACDRWRCSATTSPPITCRRRTPSWPTSAAGEYLAKMGLPEEDFNSYATHRGDHLTAQRATFANPKLFNEMCRDDNGEVIQGSLARVEPEGEQMRMWEAIETYMNRGQPLCIIAGADYGQGSSRDWAAKGVRLAGVEAIVAEGFERIHRTNLVGMGVLPLQFKDGETATPTASTAPRPSTSSASRPRGRLTVVMHRANGEQVEIPVTCRLDTAEEVQVYEAGGVYAARTSWRAATLRAGLPRDPRHLHARRHQQGRVLQAHPGSARARRRCRARPATRCCCA
jgi:hypothetical protein